MLTKTNRATIKCGLYVTVSTETHSRVITGDDSLTESIHLVAGDEI
jgi:hypothetical protein